MNFYSDFNSMFNAQSSVKKDMSVFNGDVEVFARISDLLQTVDCPDLSGGFDRLDYAAGYTLDPQIHSKFDVVFDAFRDAGRIDECKRLFPLCCSAYIRFGRLDELNSDPDVTFEFSGCPSLEMGIDDGTFVCSLRAGYGHYELDDYTYLCPIPSNLEVGYDLFSPNAQDEAVAENIIKSGVLEKSKKLIAMFQDEAKRIKDFDIDAYFGGKQYDLSNPIKEKFWMPVD